MSRIQNLFLVTLVAGLAGCSTTAKGPITHKEYKVQVGGWQDMGEYQKAREAAVNQETRTEDDVVDCNVVDCPELIRKSGTE